VAAEPPDEILDADRLAGIIARDRAATPGPWGWFGNVDTYQLYLATRHSGRLFVMGFRRWGMRGAQPEFRTRGSDGWARLQPGSTMAATELPVFEVDRAATARTDPSVYRGDIVGIRNADAEFIEHARQDVHDMLRDRHALARRAADLADEAAALRDQLEAAKKEAAESDLEWAGTEITHLNEITRLRTEVKRLTELLPLRPGDRVRVVSPTSHLQGLAGVVTDERTISVGVVFDGGAEPLSFDAAELERA
jgi:hypothetical protein